MLYEVITDNVFVGSRCIVVEGVRVETEAVLGANVVLTMSTKIIDVTGETPIEYKGRVPARSVVIPGSYRITSYNVCYTKLLRFKEVDPLFF